MNLNWRPYTYQAPLAKTIDMLALVHGPIMAIRELRTGAPNELPIGTSLHIIEHLEI